MTPDGEYSPLDFINGKRTFLDASGKSWDFQIGWLSSPKKLSDPNSPWETWIGGFGWVESGTHNETPWMNIASSQVGVSEVDGKVHNRRIIEYHSTTGKFKDDETAWCSSYVNWVMKNSGIKGTNSARAYSWKTWGVRIDKPAYGAIAIMNYSHVGFVAGINKDASGSLGGFYLSPDISSFTQFDLDDVMSFMMGKNKSSIAYFSTSAAYIYTEQNTKPLIMNTLVGQHVVIELENMNKTGVELEVSIYNSSESKAKSSKSNSRSLFDTTFNLLPNAKKSFDFYQFKPAPFNLNINLQTTISSFTNVNCKIFSTWVPGMPYDPQSDYIPK